MPLRQPPSRRAALLAAACLTALAAGPSPAPAEDEQWVRLHRGGPTSGPQLASALAVHPSGEITAAGTSCNEVLVLRLDAEGRELWFRTESEPRYYAQDVHAVADGEDALVTAVFNWPYYVSIESTIYRLDRSGDLAWSVGSSPISDAIADPAGGLIVCGNTFTGDLCACPGFIARYGRNGGLAWRNFVGDDPETPFASLDRLALDGAEHVFAAGWAERRGGTQHFACKYTLAGEPVWEIPVFPESTAVTVTSIAAGSADGALAVTGFFTAEGWVARYGTGGEPLWLRTWPAAAVRAAPLASSAGGMTYVATAIGEGRSTDIRLTAYGPAGDIAWQTAYDSGPGSQDLPERLAIAPGGSIVILGRSDGSIVVLEIDAGGNLLWASSFAEDTAQGYALAAGAAGRVLVGGEVVTGRNRDLVVLAFEESGDPQVLARADRPAAPGFSRGLDVHVGAGGEVTAAIQTSYPCDFALALVRYAPDGHEKWAHVVPSFARGQFAFAPGDGAGIAALDGAGAVEVRRITPAGDLDWIRSFASTPDGAPDGLAVSETGDILLASADLDSAVIVAASASGEERWRTTLAGIYPRKPTWAPDGRAYLWNWQGPTIRCLGPAGEQQWAAAIDLGAPLEVTDMAGADGGVLYVTGSIRRDGRYDWATLRLLAGGNIDWAAYELGGAEWATRPAGIRLHPEGGVVVAGSIWGGTGRDARVARYAEDGAELWQVSVPADGALNDLAVDRAGNVLVVIEDVPRSQTRTIKIKPEGDILWDRAFDDGGPSWYARAVAVGPDLSVGVTGPARGDSAFTLGYTDALPVAITFLAVDRRGTDVELGWGVGHATEPAGFHVLRASVPDGDYERATAAWLPGTSRAYVDHHAPAGEAYYVLEALGRDGSVSRHGPVQAAPPAHEPAAPRAFWAVGPIPNPASREVTWRLGLPAASPVRLLVHDVAGRSVTKIVESTLPPGVHVLHWDGRLASGRLAPSGVYAYRLEAGGEVRSGKLVRDPSR